VRILFARNLYRPIDLGGNRYPYEVTKRLAARGHEVLVITGGFRGNSDGPAPRVLQYPVSRAHPALTFSSNAIFGGAATTFQASRFHPDVVITSSYDLAYGYSLAGRRNEIPSVFIYHSAFYSDWTRRLAGRNGVAGWFGRRAAAFARHVERRVLRESNRVVAVSPFSLREISTSLGGGLNARCRLVPTGVETQVFSPGSRGEARATLGLHTDATVLATVGRLAPVKRYDRAIAATARLIQEGLAATLLVIGDGPERSRLERLANELGINEAVRFEGHCDGGELVTRLRAADLQLCTSEFENWSLALLEGMACGLPVVGTPFGGTAEMLGAVDPVLVLEDGEVNSIVERLNSLFADRPRLRDLGIRSRQYAESFDWGVVVERLERVLTEAIET